MDTYISCPIRLTTEEYDRFVTRMICFTAKK